MGTLICSAGIYAEIASAIRVLREIHPTSPISVWCDHAGNRSSFFIPDENIPATDRAVITDHISYLRQVLQDAVDTRNVPDIEYVVTRLVSNIEDVIAHYCRQCAPYLRNIGPERSESTLAEIVRDAGGPRLSTQRSANQETLGLTPETPGAAQPGGGRVHAMSHDVVEDRGQPPRPTVDRLLRPPQAGRFPGVSRFASAPAYSPSRRCLTTKTMTRVEPTAAHTCWICGAVWLTPRSATIARLDPIGYPLCTACARKASDRQAAPHHCVRTAPFPKAHPEKR